MSHPIVLLRNHSAIVFAFATFATVSTSRAQSASPPDGATSVVENEPARRTLVWHADPEADEVGGPPAAASLGSQRKHAEQRPFAFLMDPTTPSDRDFSLEYRLGIASGVDANRPLPATVEAAGAQHNVTLGYGITERIAPFVSAMVLQPSAEDDPPQVSGNFGARWQLTNPSNRFRVTLAGAGFREFSGTLGACGRVAASYDLDRVRFAGNLHAERAFDSDRDSVDILALAGVSYQVLNAFRFGVEYVGQDLEDAFEDEEAEGGARNFLGPNLAVDLIENQLQAVAGVAIGLDKKSPPVMGSVALLTAF